MSSPDASANRPDLPAEVWLEMLQYLSLNDLKSMRQTCHRFYDLCDRFFYENGEVVFCGNINTNAEIISLSDRERKVRNLKFVDVHLMDASILSFFHTQGAGVRSLAFRDCKVVPGLLRIVILCCENLCSFSLEVDCNRMQSQIYLERIFVDFNSLRKAGIIRQYVSSFTLRLKEETCMTHESFSNFFTIFPNIKELDLACHTAEVGTTLELLFSSIYGQLYEMRHRLEKLRLHLQGATSSVTLWNAVANTKMEKLKVLSLNWYNIQRPSVITYEPMLKHLTEFECVIGAHIHRDLSAGNFIKDLLNSATNLRSLTVLKYPCVQLYDAILGKDCFLALIRSRLEILNIDIFANTNIQHSFIDHVQPNYVLRDLGFGNLEPNNRATLLLLFTRYFHSLEFICIEKKHIGFLEHILKHQTNLRSLVCCNSSSVGWKLLRWFKCNHGFQFDYLTCLSLIENSTSNLCELILTRFKFPKLKSLAIVVKEDYCNITSLLHCIHTLTELEYLEIDWEIGVVRLSLLALYRNLPKLRYLIYSNNHYIPFDKLEYDRIFKECPILRIFIHKVDDYIYHRYVKYFNQIEYKVVSLCSRYSSESDPPPFELIYEGIPRQYRPYYWNNRARKPESSY